MVGQPLANHAHVGLEQRQPVLMIDGSRWMERGAHHKVAGLVELAAQLGHALLGTQHKLRGKVARRNGLQATISSGLGLRFEGGRHLTTLAM